MDYRYIRCAAIWKTNSSILDNYHGLRVTRVTTMTTMTEEWLQAAVNQDGKMAVGDDDKTWYVITKV
jgi:hypothetical protein